MRLGHPGRVVEGDRVDFFDARSNRMGSGLIRDGEAETFDQQGNRTGLGRWPQALVK